MFLFIPVKRKGPSPAKVGNVQSHAQSWGPPASTLSPCRASHLLAPIPRGPHLGISLAGTVLPDIKLDPDLVHCGAQFCQSWRGAGRWELGGEGRQEAALCCLTSPTRRAWHPNRKLLSPRTRPLHASTQPK